MSFAFGGPGPLGLLVVAVAAVVLIAAWIILAGSRFVQGGVVERPERIPQPYGYSACLVGLFRGLSSILALVESAQTLSAPAYPAESEYGLEPSITSFEAFRLTYDRARRFGSADPGAASLDSVPELEFKSRYDTYRRDRIAATAVRARQALIKQGVSLLLAVGLLCLSLGACRARTTEPSPTAVGCYYFDRPVSSSAAGTLEAADSAWYVLALLPDGRVDRPGLSASHRESVARQSRWRMVGDTLYIRVVDRFTGWDLALRAQDRHFRGTGRYLTDAIPVGRPPFEAAFAATVGPCAAAP